MLLHLLVFSKPNVLIGSTAQNIELMKDAAKKLGHELEIIYDYDCQMKFNGSADLRIKGHNLKDIKVLFVKANLNGAKLQFRRTFIKQFELMGVKVLNKEDAVMNAKNKLRTLQVLSENNIPMPKTYVINHADDLDELLFDIGKFPVILKAPAGAQGLGVSIIESKRGLKSVIQMMENVDPLVIQEYVKESKGKDVRVFVVGNKIVGAMERVATKRGEFRSNFHLGGRVLLADLTDSEKALAIAATKACGLDVSGVDILRTKSGPKIIEVNSNPGLEGITEATGKDIAGEIIKYMIKRAGK